MQLNDVCLRGTPCSCNQSIRITFRMYSQDFTVLHDALGLNCTSKVGLIKWSVYGKFSIPLVVRQDFRRNKTVIHLLLAEPLWNVASTSAGQSHAFI